MSNLLLTGCSGFVGGYLLQELLKSDFKVSYLGRKSLSLNGNLFHKAIIDSVSDYSTALNEIDVVVHAAARAHVINDNSIEKFSLYSETNTQGTLNLAKQAVNSGVKRFIFISSIKVNGEFTESGIPFKSDSCFIPTDPYGLSKYEAEVGLKEIADNSNMEVVIIRPTLVYGPGVKANFASLLNLVNKGVPLPFSSITSNKRSLVSIKNLVNLIITCIDHPKAANQVFLVSDDNDVSTASMIKHMSKALGKSNRMLLVPLWCYHIVGKLTGKDDVINRLLGSLQVDITHTKETLGWTPPQTIEEGFKEAADAFLLNKNK